MEIISLPVGLLLGFFIPGYLFSRLLGIRSWCLSAFIVSTMLLYSAVFYLGILGFRIDFISVLLVLGLLSCALAYAVHRLKKGFVPDDFVLPRLRGLLWIVPVAILAVILALRGAIQPFGLAPGDQLFRWNFLAVQVFREGSFSFYPPLSAADFCIYFYPDAHPPLVSFAYYWLYECLGRPETGSTAVLLVVELCLIFAVCRSLARELFSEVAGMLSVLIMATSTLLFYSVCIGQETGFTALSMGSMILFLARTGKGSDFANPVMAGVCAALGALCREYGYAIMVCGFSVFLWRRVGLRQFLAFAGVALLLSFPWYLRNWIVAGNPFYSNDFFGIFKVNEVHTGILRAYVENMGFSKGFWLKLGFAATSLLSTALIPIILGIPGAVCEFRRNGFLAVCAAAMFALWTYSTGLTPGGIYHSMRVLSPVVLILSVCGAGWIAGVLSPANIRYGKIILLVLLVPVLLQNFVAPFNPAGLPPKLWRMAAFRQDAEFCSEILRYNYSLPEGARIISDNPVYHTILSDMPEGERRISVVSLWSPELSFLFDKEAGFNATAAKCAGKGIGYMIIGRRDSLNYKYLRQFPFFSDFASRCRNLDGDLFEIPSQRRD